MNLPDQGLQLGWTGKTAAQRVARQTPFHALEPVSTHGTPGSGNLLVQGDNLQALKALLPFYKGRVKCVFIDPPYNTGSAFEHYDDKLQHSQWLSMMLPRLELLKDLLSADGSIWVTIDDNEGHYLKVLMDEVFGRGNFVTSICWEKIYTLKNTARLFSEQHDLMFVYAKSLSTFAMNHLPRDEKHNSLFKNPDQDSRGIWQDSALHARNFYSKGSYQVSSPNGKIFTPPPGRYWTVSEDNFRALDDEGRIWWGKEGGNAPRKKAFLTEVKATIVPGTIWTYQEAGQNAEAKAEIKLLFAETAEIFITPKPEKLIRRVLTIATNPGDLVLDSFLGSGTTAAVAHKMGRRWIGIEMGEHAETHCLPRLQKVIEGEQGGISTAVNWQGGGGFQFMRLGPAIFTAQRRIAPDVSFAALAALVWHVETGQPAAHALSAALLGVHEGTACYLLYNGVLGDKRPAAGNVLTDAVYRHLMATHPHAGPLVVYGEATQMGPARRAALRLTFKQLPYDLKQLQSGGT
ncbi:MAG: site-specific DNA-methyltransferase [Polaromonas sp.]|uniref:site-specific DNA-methyltransferase n=1 Tax=Polaromonas sp. TaxID=1869339 RepID=UPI002488FB90|nr:site-specific DNA-methyltransferase [Polaromonas sp.]MDI1271172.1 site-specific DNA-methyltransferase [Polaromonas sp.]